MSSSKIIVIGSSNTDMVVRTDRFPKPGETLLGYDFFMSQGGKGANQAVAAARLGGEVIFVSCVGDDVFGKTSLEALKNEGIDVSYTSIVEDIPSGVAVITIDQSGENNIVVASGANAAMELDKIIEIPSLFEDKSIVLMQLEIPLKTVEYLIQRAYEKKAKVILNPAPAQVLNEEILQRIYLLTPNEEEAYLLTGIRVVDVESAARAAQKLIDRGLRNVIITMGNKGAIAFVEDEVINIKSEQVTAVDTTGAGDVFNGAIAVALNEGKPISEALEFANRAAAIAVTRLGAQSSSPYRDEIEMYYQSSSK